MRFNKPFFQRGEFPPVVFNGSDLVALQNPWINGTDATPFDQGTPSDPLRALGYTSDIATEFYLILNVAVGSTNGWFPEGQGNKPWLDRSESMYSYPLGNGEPLGLTAHAARVDPLRDFANAENHWYPTWPTNVEDRAMIV